VALSSIVPSLDGVGWRELASIGILATAAMAILENELPAT
jgi:hypothetical protein